VVDVLVVVVVVVVTVLVVVVEVVVVGWALVFPYADSGVPVVMWLAGEV
jgi:hypothetical protein